ncbi:MAG: hypothetical protein IT497_01340 [Ottowia sp.]|nr:hypothetical protein [Ottowia sp.]
MESLEKFKEMVADLSQHKGQLHKQMLQFQSLQKEIELLRERAPTDPESQKKLDRLNTLFSGDLKALKTDLTEKILTMQTNFTNLSKQLKQIAKQNERMGNLQPATDVGSTLVTAQQTKKIRKTFV